MGSPAAEVFSNIGSQDGIRRMGTGGLGAGWDGLNREKAIRWSHSSRSVWRRGVGTWWGEGTKW
jgi:hypothetical protein